MRHNSRAGVSEKMRVTGIENGFRNRLRNSFANSPVILRWLMAGCVAVCLWLPVQAFAAGTINIYSHRQQILIQPFLDEFTKATGIQTKVVYASKGLAQRLQAEGAASPADVILTVDIARLAEYATLDLLASVESAVLTANIPAHLRASDNRWFGLSERARIVVTARDRVPADAIQRIEDLADAEWQQRICTRPGSHVYNRALMASLIAAHGAEAAAKLGA
jgi:iron(III) transport system substrate-binding protein